MKLWLQHGFVYILLGLVAACGESSAPAGSGQGSGLPVIFAENGDVLEQDSGQNSLQVTVNLNQVSSEDISFSYSTMGDSAQAGTDFISQGGTATVAAGQDSVSLSIPIVGDQTTELDESFSIDFANPVNATLQSSRVTVTIRDDDETFTPALVTRPPNSSCSIPDPPLASSGITLTHVFSEINFDAPVLMLQAPGNDNRWYVVEQDGLIKTFEAGDSSATIFADLTDRAVYTSGGDERGLLGMAFHPQFQTNQQVFLYYIADDNGLQTIVSRYNSPDNGLTLTIPDFTSEDRVLELAQPASNHNGGHIAFASDGFLYIGLGDGGSGNDFFQNGLNTQSLLGSMLRIDVDTSPAPGNRYVIPADNPFINDAQVLDEIFAYGLRNPWRWSFDRLSGELFLGDVGQTAREEIDVVQSGEHYGWGCYEGSLRNNNYAGDCSGILNNPPLHEYPRSEGVTVVGGYVYRGSNNQLTSMLGTYLYADFGFGTIWGLDPDAADPTASNRVLFNSGKQISAFAEDNNGELYVLSWSDGQIFRIDAAINNNFPALLSQTGCVDVNNPQVMDSSMIPYRINAPFWSDNADKDRWFVLQDGTAINIEADGDWSFPVGSVLVKNFRLAGRLVETRLLVHHNDASWGGYSYEWNDSETDASLVLNGKQKSINGQDYIYPSSAQCSACHTAAAGQVLGLENRQMNRNQMYPANNNAIGNQIISLDNIGMFVNSPGDVSTLAKLTAPHNLLASDNDRARAYLHSNCAQCHRPGVAIQNVDMDLRRDSTDLAACNVAPSRGDLGVPGAQRLFPGDAAQSVLYLRMNRRDDDAMPPLGSTLVDSEGSALIRRWIDGLQQCPG